jgi:cyclopropane fatty-acyl-phospholipid synthase-like methyltransferase
VATRDEIERKQMYDARFRADVLAAGVQAEVEAVGSDYGNNGFTTLDQAAELQRHLALDPSTVLLEVGSGAGWPGLYLARRSGCRVVVSDLTVPGMRNALRRAAVDDMSSQVQAVVATARHLPFKPESFDAMVHTDVLC